MPKRKLTLPISSQSKKLRKGDYWTNFGKSFFGTLGDPIGTVISMAKGQPPSWSSMRKSGIRTFDHRKGFVGGLLNSLGIGYLKDMLSGATDAVTRKSKIDAAVLSNDPRLLAYKLVNRNYKDSYRPYNVSFNKTNPFRLMPVDIRGRGIVGDTLMSIARNKDVQNVAKRLAITGAGIAIPKAIDYIMNKRKKKRIPAAIIV